MTTISKDMSLDLNKIRLKKYDIDVHCPRSFDERYINFDLFEKVIDNIDELKDFIGLCFDSQKCERIEWSGTKTILTETYKKRKKNSHVLYAPTKSNPKGRHFSKEKSLQGMSRVIRHLICHENYTDIDIKNCHPVILLQLCSAYNFSCEHLKYYIENRENCLGELMNITNLSKDECKQYFLSLLNGGTCSYLFQKYQVPEWLKQFALQIHTIHGQFRDHKDLENFVKEVKKVHGKEEDCFNFNGKVVNRLLCQYENIILQHAINFCFLNDINVASPQFDGMLCEKNDKINQNFLQNMEEYIYDKVGLRVEFSIKEMNEHLSLMERLNDMETKREKVERQKREKKEEYSLQKERKERDKVEKERQKKEREIPLPNCSDENLGIVFLERIEDNIMFHKYLNFYYIYNEHNFLWEQVPVETFITLFSKILIPYITELEIECESSVMTERYQKMKDTICSTKKQMDILKQVKIRMPDSSSFIDNNFNKKTTIFPFKDKIIDLSTGFIRQRNKDDYFTKTTNNEYIENITDNDIQKVFKYLQEILGDKDNDIEIDYINNFLLLLSHLLTNDNSLKKIITFIGEPNAGKSAFIALLESIFQEFGVIAPRRLVINSKSESVLGTEFIPLVDKRVFFISELKEDESYNEPFLKSISGNDKYFQIRGSSDKGYNKIIIQSKGIISTNESAHYADRAFIDRLLYIKFPNSFIRNAEKLTQILNLKNILFTILCDKAKELINNNYSFTPHMKMIKATKQENEEKDTVKSFMDESYIITSEKTDKVLKSSFYSNYTYYCKENDLIKISRKLFFKTLEKEPYNFFEDNTERYRLLKGYIYFCGIKQKDFVNEPVQEEEDSISVSNL